MQLSDLKGDGDFKLIIGDLFHNFANRGQSYGVQNKNPAMNQRKVKVYMGTNVIYEETLLEKPVAIQVVYDTTQKPN